jgi:secretion/DNA translocation related CpaE-like protein
VLLRGVHILLRGSRTGVPLAQAAVMAEVRRVALVTTSAELRPIVLRLAALVGAEVDVVGNSSAIRASWHAADAVVVGDDLAPAVAAAGLPRRVGVVVITAGSPDDGLWRSTVDVGATRLFVLPDDEPGLIDFLGDAADVPSANGAVIAVVGGSGGAGASTFAAALAICSARASPTLLIDGDRLGGGIDVLLGIERVAGARWADLAQTRGRLGTTALSGALPTVEGCAVLSWNRGGEGRLDAAAAESVVDAGLRAYRRVVVDLPRCLDADAAPLAAVADLIVVVVRAKVRATVAAAAVAAGLASYPGRRQVVVRDPSPGRLTAGQVAAALALPVVASVRSDSAVTKAAERGEPPVSRRRSELAAACQNVLGLLLDVPAAA